MTSSPISHTPEIHAPLLRKEEGRAKKKEKRKNSNFLMNEVTSNKSHTHTKNIAHLNILVYTVLYYNRGGGDRKTPHFLDQKIKGRDAILIKCKRHREIDIDFSSCEKIL